MARSEIEFHDPLNFFPRALTKLYSMWVSMTYKFISLGKKVSLHHTCDVKNPHLMEIGNSVIVHKDVWLHAWRGENSSVRGDKEAVLTIGDGVLVGRRSHVTARNRIRIERDVILSAGVLIQDHGHKYEDVTLTIREQGITDGGTIRIGEGAWIGQGAAIICEKGELTLGRNCVVAANAVVTKSAPDYSVVLGNPARVVKQYDPAKGAWVIGSVRPAESDSPKEEPRATNAVRS
jgi:acetyltransferase-like isoleucine patch superfamily enzyme